MKKFETLLVLDTSRIETKENTDKNLPEFPLLRISNVQFSPSHLVGQEAFEEVFGISLDQNKRLKSR